MLARIGNNLFWMARYLERAEHCARYTKVQYLSSLDAPLAQSKDRVFASIGGLVGVDALAGNGEMKDEEILYSFTLDDSQTNSIKSILNFARENARGARDVLSSELFEAINRYYHYINRITPERFYDDGVYEVADRVLEYSAIAKGHIENSLVRNQAFSVISLGLHLERATQITRILLSVAEDIEKIESYKKEVALENFHWSVAMRSCEAFDMCRRQYKATPNRQNALEFLLLRDDFPKSVCYNLNEAAALLKIINPNRSNDKNTPEFQLGKLAASLRYTVIDEIRDKPTVYLDGLLTRLYRVGSLLESKYLSY